LDIVEALQNVDGAVVEVGPGLGVLTKYLIKKYPHNLTAIDVDDRLAQLIPQQFEGIHFIHQDILKVDFAKNFPNKNVYVIGNFPYNISTEIVFKIIAQRDVTKQMVGMFQKEVAMRLAAKEGNKVYGVTSILSQAFFKVEYLFDVPPHLFEPPPKVNSGVVRFSQLETPFKIANEKILFSAVKAGFNQRRKTLRNALKVFPASKSLPDGVLNSRAEQLSVEKWVEVANFLSANL
jgi:16S rRNA (adenine1518-N6/adenine1519-N6)-dimethyltransferase